MVRKQVTGLQWIADVGWAVDPNLQTPHFMPYLRGTLGIDVRRGEIPGLKEFLLNVHPGNDHVNSRENTLVGLMFNYQCCIESNSYFVRQRNGDKDNNNVTGKTNKP